MVQLVHEVRHLDLETVDFLVRIVKLLLLCLEIERLLVNSSVELFNFVEGLGNFKFKRADVACKVAALVVLDFVSNSEAVNFLKILAVPLSKGVQFVLSLVLLVRKRLVAVALDLELMVEPLDVRVSVSNDGPLPVELSIQLCVLLSSVVV